MTLDTVRVHLVGALFLITVCGGATFEAYRENSWGIWRKSQAISNCLPLPPPIGCSEKHGTKEVLTDEETDFGWLCLVCDVICLVVMSIMCYLLSDLDQPFPFFEKMTSKQSIMILCFASGVIDILVCVIASFRMNVLSTIQRRQGIFGIQGMAPVSSTSLYLCGLAAVCAFVSAYVINLLPMNLDGIAKSKLSKTVKQHMARNVMYPEDKRSTKMITFSSMSPEMEEFAAELCVKTVMQYGLEEDVAENVKQKFEAQYGPTWHCAVGGNFGSAVQHRANEYIEVSMPEMSVLLFRCGLPGAKQSKKTQQSKGKK